MQVVKAWKLGADVYVLAGRLLTFESFTAFDRYDWITISGISSEVGFGFEYDAPTNRSSTKSRDAVGNIPMSDVEISNCSATTPQIHALVRPKTRIETLRPTLEKTLGPGNVRPSSGDIQSYSRCTLPKSTRPELILRPTTSVQVVRLIKLLREHGLRYHTISRGKNWGYGDACAPQDGAVILDLRGMDRILEINEELGYAVIEPGVSQGQLTDELVKLGSSLMLDVTGAGPDASIVGNVMQRGFGHTPYGDRTANSGNFEAVMPDGNIVRTGFGDIEGSVVGHVYPYGSGPDYRGMMQQTSGPIITRMTINLMPRPECIVGFAFRVSDPQRFGQILQRIGRMRQSGLIDSVVHMANDLRVLSSQSDLLQSVPRDGALTSDQRENLSRRGGVAAWNGLGGIYGSRRLVAAKKAEIRRNLRDLCTVRFFGKRRVEWLQKIGDAMPNRGFGQTVRSMSKAVADVYELLCGRPSANHLEGAFYRNRPESGEVSDAGLIWIAPVIPCTGRDALRLVERIEPIANRHGFDLPITISPVVARACVCISNVSFDKSDQAECDAATQCYREIRAALEELGYPPYRHASISI